jgi:cytochrome c peroxidase
MKTASTIKVALTALVVGIAPTLAALTPQQELGKALFFDQNLSVNSNQSCATCHGASVGWTGPKAIINEHGAVYEGSIPGAFGDRKPPTVAYAGDSPVLYYNAKAGAWVGGMFWDGRATGWTLGDPLAEQALGPFLNPKEQALPSATAVIGIVQASSYAGLFAEQCQSGTTAELYSCIGRAIAAFERSSEVSPFTSKYDYWLKGQAKLTAREHLGRALFQGKGGCAACHPIKGKQPLFTDFTYDNLGIPRNVENPVYDEHPSFVDWGLGGFLKSLYPEPENESVWKSEVGKHKVPTLRNVDLRPNPGFVKAFGHNGFFKSLKEIVHFYNARDVETWPAPEVPLNVNNDEVGNLRLSDAEEDAIVEFMKTLSDGYVPTGK